MTRRRMITGWLAISLAVTLLLGVGAYKFSNSRRFQAFGELIQRVETTDKVVALTFDDGPTPGDTEAVLKTLTAHNVSATFFLCGAEMAAHPSQTKLIVDAGHQVGNHSWSHQRMWFLTPNSVRKELDDTDLEIRNSGYEERIDFRPWPFASTTEMLVRRMQETVVDAPSDFLRGLDPARAHDELVDDTLVRESIRRAGGLEAFGLSSTERTEEFSA